PPAPPPPPSARGCARRTRRRSSAGAGPLPREGWSCRPEILDELLGRRREMLALAMDDAERAEQRLVRQLDRDERLLLHLGPHGGLGQDGDGLTDLHHSLDGLDVVQLHHVAHLCSMSVKKAIGLLAGGNVALEAHQRLAGELAHRYGPMAREGGSRWHNEDQTILTERDDGDARSAPRKRHHPEVDVAAHGILVDLARAAVLEVELNLRESLQVALERRRQLVEADRVHGGDADRAPHEVGGRLELGLHLLEALHDLLAGLVEDLPGRRELNVATRALEEAAPPAVFQHPDLLADGGLRCAVLRRRGGEAPALHHVTEHL